MVSDWIATVFTIILVAILLFIIWSLRIRHLPLIHKLYLGIAISFGIWLVALLCIKYTDPANTTMLWVWDSFTYIGVAFSPAFTLCIALVFTKGWERMKPLGWAAFIIPAATNVIVWTNPIHHLQYKVFSVVKSEIVFGPYIYVSGLYTYICLVTGIVLMISFAIKNDSRLYLKQCILFSLGGLAPLVVSSIATFGPPSIPITATPLSFVATVVCNGIAIYQLHLLDIKPIATQHILNWITDCYLVVSDEGLALAYNKPFEEMFSDRFGIKLNHYLSESVKEEDVAKKTAVYNLMTAIESCRQSGSAISYEQAVGTYEGDLYKKNYYITDVTPLVINDKLSGFVVLYKDITQLKKSMQQLQDSQTRMMEQERMAFLGQMMAGLAHNLKTPIMSISGCVSAAEDLVEECVSSLDDPEVVPSDYQEIYSEMGEWFQRIRESTAYMSDIITAIKGQAASVNLSEDTPFTVDELVGRSRLLMRHELQSGNCSLEVEYEEGKKDFTLHGDINNLVQVLNNLLSNAVYAQKQTGGGAITVGVRQDGDNLKIYVRDTGPGVKPQIRSRLFKEMITSKGTMGTGLGLYISNTVVRGKFGGSMWVEDNPGGGSIFGMTIPLAAVSSNDSNEEEGSRQ
ncbi:MAG: histidine kinase N-terminal 7TM domain-containing protein [Oscillospiraceae bacterium]|nr:histidine kinase N-terminal 7TM domain-containing protein [Oscillospiraceae bacterium]